MVADSQKRKIALDEEGRPLGSGVSQTRTGNRQWHPTKAQVAALEYCQDHDYGFKVTKLVAEIGIARRSYYDWFRTPAFVQWWKDNLHAHFVIQVPRVYAILFRALTTDADVPRPSIAAAKLFLKRFDEDYAPRARRDVSVKSAMNVKLSDDKIIELCRRSLGRFAQDAT